MRQKINAEKGKFYFNVAPVVWGMKDIFVNMYMIQNRNDANWVLVDAGLKISAPKIRKMAADLFGNKRPKAIILTHGHFDHVGSLKKLASEWNVPVYAHYLELPYVTGKSSYPPPDPTVGGGLMATMAFLYPYHPIDVEEYIVALPEDNSVPGLQGWRYMHTPGHTPGHISLFREEDKVLIAGDAFVTTKAESVLSIIRQTKKICGPPKYLTPDWEAADESVKQLLLLAPEAVATGHGLPMYGREMRKELHNLHEHFYELAVPSNGRYINEAAIADVNGVLYVPPKPLRNYLPLIVVASSILIFATAITLLSKKQKRKKRILSGIFG